MGTKPHLFGDERQIRRQRSFEMKMTIEMLARGFKLWNIPAIVAEAWRRSDMAGNPAITAVQYAEGQQKRQLHLRDAKVLGVFAVLLLPEAFGVDWFFKAADTAVPIQGRVYVAILGCIGFVCFIVTMALLGRCQRVDLPSKSAVASVEKLCGVLDEFATWVGLDDATCLIGGSVERWQALAETVLNNAALAKHKIEREILPNDADLTQRNEHDSAIGKAAETFNVRYAKLKAIGLTAGSQVPYFAWAEAQLAVYTGNPCGSQC